MSLSIVALVVLSCVAGAQAATWPSHVRELTTFAEYSTVSRRVDEISVYFIYDSADANSVRMSPDFTASASPLTGFASFYAIDIRNPAMNWLMDHWAVQIVPCVRGTSNSRMARAAWESTGLAGLSAVKEAKEMAADQTITEASLKQFVMSLQSGAAITRIDLDSKIGPLHDAMSAPKERPAVVLFTNKAQSTALFKAVSIAFTGRADFLEVNEAKASSASKRFGFKSSPALMLFDTTGKRTDFEGALNVQTILAFIEPFVTPRAEFEARTASAEAKQLSREILRKDAALLPVETAQDWNADVLSRSSITGVFFFEGPALVASRTEAVRDFMQRLGTRSSVGQFVWVDKTKQPKLYEALAAPRDQEPSELVFVSGKKKVVQRYLGSPSGANIHDFVVGPMSRGVGSVSFNQLPDFEG